MSRIDAQKLIAFQHRSGERHYGGSREGSGPEIGARRGVTAGAIKMSQRLDVLQLRSDEAYPISSKDWESLKSKVRSMSYSPWFYQTVGSALVGAALSSAVALFATLSERQHIVAWASVVVTAVCGAWALWFAHQQKSVRQAQASDVLTQMEAIERCYERVGIV